MADSVSLRRAWEDHPYYRYRGCAPDADDGSRMAGDPSLPLGAHHAPDVDGGEPRAERLAREAAAVEVCLGCPVMVLCDAYASSVTAEGRLAEPDGVWGARTAGERAVRAGLARSGGGGDRRLETPQRLAVLRALAVCWEPAEVAARVGVDVRTANWQRSSLVTLLGLPRGASRRQLLAEATRRGLLEGVEVVRDDGTVPAVPTPSSPASSSRASGTAAVSGLFAAPRSETPGQGLECGRAVVRVVPRQLSLDDALAAARRLFAPRALEGAA